MDLAKGVESHPRREPHESSQSICLDSHLGTAGGFNIAASAAYNLGFPANAPNGLGFPANAAHKGVAQSSAGNALSRPETSLLGRD
jgi:hypothetical protein